MLLFRAGLCKLASKLRVLLQHAQDSLQIVSICCFLSAALQPDILRLHAARPTCS